MEFTSEVHNQILFLNFTGNLIGDNPELELMNLIEENLENNIVLCAIDISEVEFINSSGIGLLITILTRFRNKSGEVFLIKPSDQVKKLLIITKLYAIFNIVDTKKEAIDKLNKIK
jgi:anti-sigma B factor antagonist